MDDITAAILLLICSSVWVNCMELNITREYDRQIIRLAKSADIKSFMKDVDPCEDFYTYACGTWHEINTASKVNGKISTDKFQSLTQGIEKRLTNLLLTEKAGSGEVEDKIKDFYNSCLNAQKDSQKYRQALSEIYKEFGEFSAFKSEETSGPQNYDWSATVAKIQYKYGTSIILSVYILDDVKNKSQKMAYIGPPEFKLTQAAVSIQDINEERIRKYLKLYLNIAPEEAAKMADNIMTFEHYLTEGTTDVNLGKSVEELLTLYNTTDLFEKYQYSFDVKEYLEIVLGTKELPKQVYVYDESYLKGLYDVFNSTDHQLAEDYIVWLFLEEYIIDIKSDDLVEECTDKSKKYFSKFIDNAIYNKYRSTEIETEIYELWDDIKSTFRNNLRNNEYKWMSNATTKEAIKKLDNMNLTINSYDNEDFIKMFKNLDIDPTNYVINVQSILTHAESLRENKMQKKSEEDAQLLSYTPIYNILDNEIKIPVALLQPFHVWDAIYPRAIMYGTLGYLIAHEMIHGFDDEGRKYDETGSAQNWWDDQSASEFEERRKCFEEQYHKYKYDGKFLAKSVMQSENIADNGGLNIAYDAYVRWLEKHKTPASHVEADDTLPRLKFNNRQLFFISFAQLWCEDIHPSFRASLMEGDKHAPAMYRVIGPLSNSKQFSWIFKCNQKSSRMDPEMKCKIY